MFHSLKNTFLTILLYLIGLVTYSQTFNFKNYNTEQGLPQSQVLAIFQDHRGSMWFGTNSGGVGKYDGNKFTTFSENDGLANNVVYSITQNHKNELLFGTMKGLSVYNGSTFKTYAEKQGLTNSYIFKVLNADNKVWIGTMEGVYTLEDNLIKHFNADSILNKSSVYSIFIDKTKNIWFATL